MAASPWAESRQALVDAINAYLADPTLHQDRRDKVMDLWDVRPKPPGTRSEMAMRELEALLAG